MKIGGTGGQLRISDLEELGIASASSFEAEVSAALSEAVKGVEVDLSQTRFLDCSGLRALMAVRKHARACCPEATIRLVNPPGAARRLFQLADMEQLFVVDRGNTEQALRS